MIPVPGKSLCYAHIDLSTGTNECYNHRVSFATREELGKHMERMKRRWLWRHHPIAMLLATFAAGMEAVGGRR